MSGDTGNSTLWKDLTTSANNFH